MNSSFLDAGIFERFFAGPLRPYRDRVATLIFEFGTFSKAVFPSPGDFMARLEPFLAALPKGFRYSVEIRNPEYFVRSRSPGAARRSQRRPCVQRLDTHASAGRADSGARRLFGGFHGCPCPSPERPELRAGGERFRAVRADAVVKSTPGARGALRQIARDCLRWKTPAFLFVNNRLEGNAPSTIESVVADFG